MKKTFLTILLFFICIPTFAGVLTYTLYPVNYPVFIDGNPMQSNLPIMAYKDNTYVPLKAVLDMMGAETKWNGRVDITTSQADPNKIAESCVEIYVIKDGKEVGQGSGVFIGYNEIITNHHVIVAGNAYRIVYNDGTVTQGTLMNDYPNEDVAILEPIGRQVKPVKIGDSDELKINDRVFAISSPKMHKNVITQGQIIEYGTFDNVQVVVSTALTDLGSSGGSLFNKNGELVGIIKGTGINERYGQSYSIPINDARKQLAN